MHVVTFGENLHEMTQQGLLSGKIRKNIINESSAELTQSWVKVDIFFYLFILLQLIYTVSNFIPLSELIQQTTNR